MKRAIILLLILLFCCLPSLATTVSFSNPHETTQKDILIYYINGTPAGTYNTTSENVLLDGNSSYQVVLKPTYTNPLDDPVGWLNSIFAYVQTNITAIVLIFFIFGYLVTRR